MTAQRKRRFGWLGVVLGLALFLVAVPVAAAQGAHPSGSPSTSAPPFQSHTTTCVWLMPADTPAGHYGFPQTFVGCDIATPKDCGKSYQVDTYRIASEADQAKLEALEKNGLHYAGEDGSILSSYLPPVNNGPCTSPSPTPTTPCPTRSHSPHPTETVTVTAPGSTVTETATATVTETAPGTTETATETVTAPPVTETVTAPPVTETATVTAPASTATETSTETSTATETATVTAPAATSTQTLVTTDSAGRTETQIVTVRGRTTAAPPTRTASTGANVGPIAIAAGLCLGVGALCLLAGRRRPREH